MDNNQVDRQVTSTIEQSPDSQEPIMRNHQNVDTTNQNPNNNKLILKFICPNKITIEALLGLLNSFNPNKDNQDENSANPTNAHHPRAMIHLRPSSVIIVIQMLIIQI